MTGPAPCSGLEPTLGRINQSRNMAALSGAEHPVMGSIQGELDWSREERTGGRREGMWLAWLPDAVTFWGSVTLLSPTPRQAGFVVRASGDRRGVDPCKE